VYGFFQGRVNAKRCVSIKTPGTFAKLFVSIEYSRGERQKALMYCCFCRFHGFLTEIESCVDRVFAGSSWRYVTLSSRKYLGCVFGSHGKWVESVGIKMPDQGAALRQDVSAKRVLQGEYIK
jgi:hypothetical protein